MRECSQRREPPCDCTVLCAGRFLPAITQVPWRSSNPACTRATEPSKRREIQIACPVLIHERHGIADVDGPARLTWHHRHAKGRLLLPKHRGQGGENRHVPFPGCGIGVRRETPDFRPDHVKRHRAYAHLAPYPTLLLPGTQPLKRNVGAKAKLAAFNVCQRRRQRVETPTAVECHLPCFSVVVARREAVANDSEREPLRVARKWILVEREHIIRHRGREPLSAFLIEDRIH